MRSAEFGMPNETPKFRVALDMFLTISLRFRIPHSAFRIRKGVSVASQDVRFL